MEIYNPYSEFAYQHWTDENMNAAYMAGKIMVNIFNLRDFPKANMLTTKQNIMSNLWIMHFRKHSCLLKPFNFLLNSYISCGFFVHGEKNYQPKYKVVEENGPKPFKINQVTGIITIYLCLIFTSIIVFMLEMITKRYKTPKIILNFLTFNSFWN